MQIELIVREGQQPGRTFQLERGDRKTIGRAPDCDIRLPDQGVSRRHCTIENLGREIQVIDLDSANGTYVNGKLVEVAPLRPGDQLAVGPTVLECREIKPQSNLDSTTGEARLAIREESANTVVRKVVDTLYPGVETGEAGRPETLAELKRAQKNLATAYQVSKMLASARDLQGLFDGVIGSIFKTLNADRAALLLKQNEDGETGELQIVAARTRKEGQDPGEIAVSRTVVQDVLENAASSLSRDASTDERYMEGQSIIQQNIRSVMCVPVTTDENVLGVLYADSKSLTGAFTENDLELLALIGNQAGVSIHRVQLMDQLEKFFFDTIRAIVATIDAKDGYTHRHSERVAGFASRIAAELGRSEEEIQVVQLSGLLHDVGKVGVPEAILNKPGKLTKAEFDEIKKHPIHGLNILSNIKSPRFEAILPGVRNHHEKWDGSGYPDSLAGEDIPFLGRLLAVADVLDALSSDRSYRKGLGFDKTVQIIQKDAGSHFDPAVAAAAAALHDRGELLISPEWIEPGPESEPEPTTMQAK